MKVRLWKGYHSADLPGLVRNSWAEEDLLILCPPLLRDFSFASCLPSGDLQFFGDFTPEQIEEISRQALTRRNDFPLPPRIAVFTSGTMSGTPRLVFYSQRNVESSIGAIYGLFSKLEIDKIFCFPQAFHTFGLVLGYLAATLLEKELVTPIGKYGTRALELRQQLRETRVMTLGTPTHFYDWLQLVRKTGARPHDSTVAICGGASVSKTLWKAMRDELGIHAPSIGYGCTEASPGITHLDPGIEPREDGEIGRPLPSIISKVFAGEGVEIQGPSLCLAIAQNGEMQFPQRIRIRDRIHVRPDGLWVYQGRTDLVLNRGGQKFSLEDFESRLFAVLGRQATAVAVTDERLGHDLGLAVLGERDNALETAILNLLRESFGLNLQPRNLLWMNEFPLNESAKLDRRAVTTLFQERA